MKRPINNKKRSLDTIEEESENESKKVAEVYLARDLWPIEEDTESQSNEDEAQIPQDSTSEVDSSDGYDPEALSFLHGPVESELVEIFSGLSFAGNSYAGASTNHSTFDINYNFDPFMMLGARSDE